jgi:hypothetical protein
LTIRVLRLSAEIAPYMRLYQFSLRTLFFLFVSVLVVGCKGKKHENYIDLSFPSLPDTLQEKFENIHFIRWERSPILFNSNDSAESINWIGVCGTRQLIRIFPNRGFRDSLGIKSVSKITGVNHFLLDMDLVSHYVHPYTRNFYNRLRPADFVMKYSATDSDSTIGFMEFIRKKDVKSEDALGYNLAFFRQWKLSEIMIDEGILGTKVKFKICDFNPICFCPMVNKTSSNPFPIEVPIWQSNAAPGWVNINKLNVVGKYDGGNVILIWEYKRQIWFQEMHGSLGQIITQALRIRDISNSDVSIAISDAGPMSASFKSDSTNTLEFKEINKLDNIPYIGAGYGYFPSQVGVYRYDDGINPAIDFIQTY